jgi:hypothetical protein
MEDFARHFLAYGRDMTLVVEYPSLPGPKKPAPK